MYAARIPDDRRAAIRAAIEACDGRSRAAIAREFSVGPRTVQRIADEAGVERPWDTSGTRQATAAARDHLRAKRAAVSARFLDEADRLLDKLRAPYVVHAFGGKDNEFNAARLAEPDAGADPNRVVRFLTADFPADERDLTAN